MAENGMVRTHRNCRYPRNQQWEGSRASVNICELGRDTVSGVIIIAFLIKKDHEFRDRWQLNGDVE